MNRCGRQSQRDVARRLYDVRLVATPTRLSDFSNELLDSTLKWSWACRALRTDGSVPAALLLPERSKPRRGDAALVHVDKVGHHHHVESDRERRLRLYRGDRLICVFGERYATDVYEGLIAGVEHLHLLTGSGVIGTVALRNHKVGRPTALSFLGYLADPSGRRINLIERLFQPIRVPVAADVEVIVVVGTAMNSGKTTVVRKMLRALVAAKLPVAACKLTGTASSRDLREMRATGAAFTTDFNDYGFPSTYGASLDELVLLFDHMRKACNEKGGHVVVMEIADGCLQRETQMLLTSDDFRRRVRGVIVAGACSSSTLYAVDCVQGAGLDVWAVSGRLTSSPLFVREFASRSPIPVLSSCSHDDWASLIMTKLVAAPHYPWAAAAEVTK